MREIVLVNGMIAMVDDEDFEMVSKYRWRHHPGHRAVYAATWIKAPERGRKKGGGFKQRAVMMHHMIVGKEKVHDHKDNNGLNTQKSNLRPASLSQNNANRRKTSRKTQSQYKGVRKSTEGKTWQANIEVENKNRYLGCFPDELSAAKAYDKAAVFYFGEFARVNLEDSHV